MRRQRGALREGRERIDLPISGGMLEAPVPMTVRQGLGPVDNYLSQTIMQVMQIMDMKAWAVLS